MAYTKTFWYLKFSSWNAVTPWAASTGYVAGQWVRQLAAPTAGQERTFVCIFAGTSGLSEPTWNVTRGQKTTTDGTVIWQECTGIPGPCGDVTNTSSWTVVKNTAVSLGQVIKDVAATTYFICTTSGTTGNGSEPSWNTTAGQTTNDNTVVWTSLGAISGYSTPFQYPFARLAGVMATGFMLAGETAYASNNHSETQASALSITTSNATQAKPLNILCVNDSVAPPSAIATGAIVATTGANGVNISLPNCYFNGFSFSAGDAANTANVSTGNSSGLYFDTCTLKINNSSTSSTIQLGAATAALSYWPTLISCALVFGATGQSMPGANNGFAFAMIGGTIAATGSVPTTLFNPGSSHQFNLLLRDVDLSNVSGTLGIGSSNDGTMYMENCKINASLILPAAMNGSQQYFKMHNCDSAATNYRYYYAGNAGTVQQNTSIYNNAGATNGITNESWKFISSANTTFTSPFVSEEITIWNDNSGGSKTAKIELTCASTLNNNDIWVEIEYPSSSAAPLGATVSTRMTWFGTPTALTASSATWTGALANVYKMSVAFTPQMKGPVKARIYVAKPSTTLYIDPLLTIS